MRTTRRRFGSIRRISSGRYQASLPIEYGSSYRLNAPVTFQTLEEAEQWLSLVEQSRSPLELHRLEEKLTELTAKGAIEQHVQGAEIRGNSVLIGGKIFKGRYVSRLSDQGEGPYIAKLAIQLGGVPEVRFPAGRADLITENAAFEVEPVRSWRKGAQQALAYGAMSTLRPALALFGEADYLTIYLEIRDKLPMLELWGFRTPNWLAITSRRKAQLKFGRLAER